MSAPAKKIGPFLATCIVAGNMIGSGIFLLPAVLASVGAASLLGWLFAAFAAIILAASYSVLAVHRPPSEGLIEYPAKAFHPAAGFINWLAYWSACWVGNIAVLLAAIGYLTALLSISPGRIGETSLLIAVIWIIALANLIGPRFVGRMSAATLIFGLAPILAAIAIAAFKFDPALFKASWNVSGEPLLEAIPPIVLTIFWAFLGLESANAVASVVNNPQRNVPFAAVTGTLIAALVYALASASLFGLIPAEALSQSSAPFADAVSAAIGPVAGMLIAGAAFARTFGCGAGWFLVSAETNRAGAVNSYLPAFMSAPKDKNHYRRDVLMIAVMMTIVSLATISPTLNAQFVLIVDISVLLFLLVYMLSSLSLIRFSAAFETPKLRLIGRFLGVGGIVVSAAIALGYFLF